jgi:nucleoside-diphosphate-sugar epimerase
MKILVTGNMGYVGPVLIRHLRRRFPDAVLAGFDSGFFGHCLTTVDPNPERYLDVQYFGDVRDLSRELLEGVDAVVQLAAISNDPMGDRFADATDEINCRSSIRLAKLAAEAGVGHFVFASSCSVYGFAEGGARTETDAVNPLTAYAKSKVNTELRLRQAELRSMVTTCLRFATACGASPRLRLDLVLNDFVAAALASSEITVLSDGTPWRPLIDVSDMARAIEWAATRDQTNGGRLAVLNVGADQWNYQVRELAGAVAEQIPGTRVSINTAAPPDRRSYRVDFSRFAELAPDHLPQMTLTETVRSLKESLMAIGFSDRNFRKSSLIRLNVLGTLIDRQLLRENMRWVGAVS